MARARFLQAARGAGLPWWERLHGYVYARWPYAYIGAALRERPIMWLWLPFMAPFLVLALFPRRWGASYHGKALPTEQATRLVRIREPIAVTLPEQVIPFETARDLVLVDPEHIVALDCPCRVARREPCLPLDVCLIVGEPFASFVLAHHPRRARAVSADEAQAILEAEADRGHVHHAFFKEAMLGRFYAICNCCSCCCGAISAHRHGTPMLISSGYVAAVDPALCRACCRCVQRCPFGALRLAEALQVDHAACMGCGVCVRSCPNNALCLVRAADKPAPLLISEIAACPAMAPLGDVPLPTDSGGAE